MKYISTLLALFTMNSHAAILGNDLGLVFGNDVIPIISSGSDLPASESREFSTSEENQNAVVIHIGQEGDQGISSIFKFDVTGINSLPAGQAKIKVILDVTKDKKLTITVVSEEITESVAYGQFDVE
jgi:molecular chaperone DnaK (HSP70)